MLTYMMKRGAPIARKTPLKRGNAQMARSRIKPKRPRHESTIEFRGAEKAAIERRSGGRCEVGGPHCTGKARVIHHRHLRGLPLGIGTRENGLHLCPSCHSPLVHLWVGWSYRHGLMVRRGVDPATIPVFTGCPLECTIDHVNG